MLSQRGVEISYWSRIGTGISQSWTHRCDRILQEAVNAAEANALCGLPEASGSESAGEAEGVLFVEVCEGGMGEGPSQV